MKDELTEETFTRIWNELSRDIYRFSYSLVNSEMDAEDITQRSFLQLWEKGPRKLSDAKPYLMSSAYHKSLDSLRSKRSSPSQIDEEHEADAPTKDFSDLYLAMGRLPKKQREAVSLFYFGGLSSKEVSIVLRISVSAVLKTLERARKALKEAMDNGK